MRKTTIWVPTMPNTNRAVQSQKKVRSLNLWIYKVEELYYPCSENKGADQLRSYCEADLRLCFRICRLLVFPCSGSIIELYPSLPPLPPTEDTSQILPIFLSSIWPLFSSPSLSCVDVLAAAAARNASVELKKKI